MNRFLNYLYIIAIVSIHVWSGKAQTGAVSISGDKVREADKHAVLDLFSDDKGLLIPRIKYEDMIALEPDKDGMIVYVTDADAEGFYFWELKGFGKGAWNKLSDEDDAGNIAPAPAGTIIMYPGPFTGLFNADGSGIGEMSGWQICNGQNGSPNLTGRFLKGADGNQINNYETIDKYSAEEYRNKQSLKEDNIIEHLHTLNSNIEATLQDHAHIEVHESDKKNGDEPRHTHITDGSVKNSNGAGKTANPLYKETTKNGSVGFWKFKKVYNEFTRRRLDPVKINIRTKNPDTSFDFNIPEKTEGTGSEEEFDIRPPFTVMVYLIKTE